MLYILQHQRTRRVQRKLRPDDHRGCRPLNLVISTQEKSQLTCFCPRIFTEERGGIDYADFSSHDCKKPHATKWLNFNNPRWSWRNRGLKNDQDPSPEWAEQYQKELLLNPTKTPRHNVLIRPRPVSQVCSIYISATDIGLPWSPTFDALHFTTPENAEGAEEVTSR
jgi:hypothetical protein